MKVITKVRWHLICEYTFTIIYRGTSWWPEIFKTSRYFKEDFCHLRKKNTIQSEILQFICMQTYLWEAWITLAPWEQGIIKSPLCLGRNNAFVINNKSEFWPLDLLDTKKTLNVCTWQFWRNLERIVYKVLTCYELIQF